MDVLCVRLLMCLIHLLLPLYDEFFVVLVFGASLVKDCIPFVCLVEYRIGNSRNISHESTFQDL